MDEVKSYCECGCGGEVRRWKNGRSSPFLRGHHMRSPEYKTNRKNPDGKFYCMCGCGGEIEPLPSGHVNKYLHNHHRKNLPYSFETRKQRLMNRWKKEPLVSPYIPDTFISLKAEGRWYASGRDKNGKHTIGFHSNLVYKYYFGDIPKGMVVHHKDGKHNEITDDRPENLMLLSDEWNLRFFPVLAKGFGIPEKIVTDNYITVFDGKLSEQELFSRLCEALVHRND